MTVTEMVKRNEQLYPGYRVVKLEHADSGKITVYGVDVLDILYISRVWVRAGEIYSLSEYFATREEVAACSEILRRAANENNIF